jgi:hypothetical protein
MPTAKITPTPTSTQGFASYSICGVQNRMHQFYRALGAARPDSFTILPMSMRGIFRRFGLTSPWSVELALGVLGLLLGATLMPILIFYAGAATLGRYEGASLGRLYHSLLAGLSQASIASWTVLLGPYGLYLLFKGLRAWWRAGAQVG